MRPADHKALLDKIHAALVDAVWRDTWEPLLVDPAALAREAGIDAGDLDTWHIVRTFWSDFVAAYVSKIEKMEEETI